MAWDAISSRCSVQSAGGPVLLCGGWSRFLTHLAEGMYSS